MVNFSFMAFAKGKETTEATEFKRYYGVAPVRIKGVNMSKAELEALYERSFDNDPVYVADKEINGEKVKTVRIEFILQTAEEVCNINTLYRMSIYLENRPLLNSEGSKVQVIDKYGRTAWVTKEDFKNKNIPMYANGPARIDSNYRACLIGEETLIKFLKTFLSIPNVESYNNTTKEWKMVTNPSDSEVTFDDIQKFFTGDVEEIRNTIAYQPNNTIKVMVGLKTTDDNKLYPQVLTDEFVNGGSNYYVRLFKAINDKKARGGYPNIEVFEGDIKEYELTPTSFKQEDPLGASIDNDPWKM